MASGGELLQQLVHLLDDPTAASASDAATQCLDSACVELLRATAPQPQLVSLLANVAVALSDRRTVTDWLLDLLARLCDLDHSSSVSRDAALHLTSVCLQAETPSCELVVRLLALYTRVRDGAWVVLHVATHDAPTLITAMLSMMASLVAPLGTRVNVVGTSVALPAAPGDTARRADLLQQLAVLTEQVFAGNPAAADAVVADAVDVVLSRRCDPHDAGCYFAAVCAVLLGSSLGKLPVLAASVRSAVHAVPSDRLSRFLAEEAAQPVQRPLPDTTWPQALQQILSLADLPIVLRHGTADLVSQLIDDACATMLPRLASTTHVDGGIDVPYSRAFASHPVLPVLAGVAAPSDTAGRILFDVFLEIIAERVTHASWLGVRDALVGQHPACAQVMFSRFLLPHLRRCGDVTRVLRVLASLVHLETIESWHVHALADDSVFAVPTALLVARHADIFARLTLASDLDVVAAAAELLHVLLPALPSSAHVHLPFHLHLIQSLVLAVWKLMMLRTSLSGTTATSLLPHVARLLQVIQTSVAHAPDPTAVACVGASAVLDLASAARTSDGVIRGPGPFSRVCKVDRASAHPMLVLSVAQVSAALFPTADPATVDEAAPPPVVTTDASMMDELWRGRVRSSLAPESLDAIARARFATTAAAAAEVTPADDAAVLPALYQCNVDTAVAMLHVFADVTPRATHLVGTRMQTLLEAWHPTPSGAEYLAVLPRRPTFQRDLHLHSCFSRNPLLFALLDLLSQSPSVLVATASDVVTSLLATLVGLWHSEACARADDSPLFPQTGVLLAVMTRALWLPPPLCYLPHVLAPMAPSRVNEILFQLWKFLHHHPPQTSQYDDALGSSSSSCDAASTSRATTPTPMVSSSGESSDEVIVLESSDQALPLPPQQQHPAVSGQTVRPSSSSATASDTVSLSLHGVTRHGVPGPSRTGAYQEALRDALRQHVRDLAVWFPLFFQVRDRDRDRVKESAS